MTRCHCTYDRIDAGADDVADGVSKQRDVQQYQHIHHKPRHLPRLLRQEIGRRGEHKREPDLMDIRATMKF